MELITESKLRELYKKGELDCLRINNDSLITPSARQYIRDKKIEVITENEDAAAEQQPQSTAQSEAAAENNQDQISKGRAKVEKSTSDFKYQSYYTGASFKEKPEAMTQIFGRELVYKDHPIIEFRGKIDNMQSKILEVMLLIAKDNLDQLYQDLKETLTVLRNVLSAEVKGNEFDLDTILGLTAAEIREHSHYPQKYYGVKHILPGTEMGEILVRLNSLRSSVREVEIAAVKAFHWEREVGRSDLIKVLNRMSSVYYIMMCKYQAGEYN